MIGRTPHVRRRSLLLVAGELPIGAILLAALLSAAPTVAQSAEPPERRWNFRVLLDDREIGWHRYVVSGSEDSLLATSNARFDVRVLFVDAYAYRHAAREAWQGPCLESLESRTETNGDLERVAAAARDGELVVAGPTGTARHDGCVMSFAYWNPRILRARQLLNSQTGELLPVTVTPGGEEPVIVSGRALAAMRYRLAAPDLKIDLWYAGDRWVALEAPAAGGRRLRYELQ